MANFRTLKALSEQFLGLLGDRNQDSEISGPEAILAVKQALAEVIRDRYFLGLADEGAEIDGSLIRRHKKAEVKYDKEFCEYYIDFPAQTISLPHGQQIRSVQPDKDPGTWYAPVVSSSGSLTSGLECFDLEGSIGYYQEGNRLVFRGMGKGSKPENVIVKSVIGFDGVNEEEDLNIPADMQLEVLRKSLQVYGVALPADIVNDNIDMPTQ